MGIKRNSKWLWGSLLHLVKGNMKWYLKLSLSPSGSSTDSWACRCCCLLGKGVDGGCFCLQATWDCHWDYQSLPVSKGVLYLLPFPMRWNQGPLLTKSCCFKRLFSSLSADMGPQRTGSHIFKWRAFSVKFADVTWSSLGPVCLCWKRNSSVCGCLFYERWSYSWCWGSEVQSSSVQLRPITISTLADASFPFDLKESVLGYGI